MKRKVRSLKELKDLAHFTDGEILKQEKYEYAFNMKSMSKYCGTEIELNRKLTQTTSDGKSFTYEEWMLYPLEETTQDTPTEFDLTTPRLITEDILVEVSDDEDFSSYITVYLLSISTNERFPYTVWDYGHKGKYYGFDIGHTARYEYCRLPQTKETPKSYLIDERLAKFKEDYDKLAKELIDDMEKLK